LKETPMRRLLIAACCLLTGAGVRAQGNAPPRFSGAFALPYLVCDCDPADFVFRTTRPVPGYAEPDASGPVVRTVAAGRLIEGNDWDRGLTVVVAPSVAVARRDVVYTGLEVFGDARYLDGDLYEAVPTLDTLRIAEGDTVEVMTWDEGYVYFRYGGVLYGSGESTSDDDFRWLTRGDGEAWWLHLTPRPGRSAAWVRIVPDPAHADHNVEIVCGTHVECDR
jgi:hypothetical protein